MTLNSKREVALCGRVNKPGIVNVPPKATLQDIIDLGGGILDKRKFKAAHLGMPFGNFITEEYLEKELDFSLFENTTRTIIILSEEDCIVQYAKYYIDYLFGKLQDGTSFEHYKKAEGHIKKMWHILDCITKGKSNMRDIYLLRSLGNEVKGILNQNKNIIEEIIEHFYDEIKEHIDHHKCYTMQCNNLIKITITDKCIGCGACAKACPVDCIIGERKVKHYIDYTRGFWI